MFSKPLLPLSFALLCILNITRVRYFQILDKLVTQVVMDRKGIKNEDFSSNGWSVAMLIDKFAEQDQINKYIQEAKEAKQLYEKTIKEKQELETEINLKGDGLIGQLRDKMNSLEDLLRISRNTIATLQRKLKDTQQEYEMNITALDQQLREIYSKAVAANNDVKESAEKNQNGQFVLGREEVTRAYDRLKAQAILEGKPEDNDYQNVRAENELCLNTFNFHHLYLCSFLVLKDFQTNSNLHYRDN